MPGLIVFGDFMTFTAYRFSDRIGYYGLEQAWRSSELGTDELEVVRTTEHRIEGRAWDAAPDKMVGFSLDVRTGEHEGGPDPGVIEED